MGNETWSYHLKPETTADSTCIFNDTPLMGVTVHAGIKVKAVITNALETTLSLQNGNQQYDMAGKP
jgi:hypothetical protein